MYRPAACSLLLGALVCAPHGSVAQQAADSATDTVTSETVPSTPPPPTPAQERYLQGLRTAGRGVAQMKDGIGRLVRARSRGDTALVRRAGRRLAGLCGAARGFIVSGRSRMAYRVYEAPVRRPARSVALRLDSLAAYARTCQREAGKTPQATSAGLLTRLRAYEAALADFRTAIGLPNR